MAGHNSNVHAVGSNSLETTYILFELPYIPAMLLLAVCTIINTDYEVSCPGIQSKFKVQRKFFYILKGVMVISQSLKNDFQGLVLADFFL